MLRILNAKLRRLCRRLRWPLYRRRRRDSPKVVIQKLGKSDPSVPPTANGSASAVHPNYGHSDVSNSRPPPTKTTVRIATFNAAFFSMAPAVPQAEKSSSLPSSFDFDHEGLPLTPTAANKANNNLRAKSANLDRPKSILKQSSSPCPLHPINGADHLTKQQKFARSKLRVSINLPDNEISLLRNRRRLSFGESEIERGRDSESHNPPSSSVSRIFKGKAPLRSSSSSSLSFYGNGGQEYDQESARRQFQYRRSVVEVLRELDADIIALQEVKAEEEREMKPLSDLAAGLGMNYAFAESWAPEYGNAVLSKWPIKRWRVQKIFDDSDFRNVLKATIDVPQVGEVNLHCTHLDHLDENWRMKQINSIIQSSDDRTHILAGGLNSLDETDYSHERWTDIVKYYEEIGKPTPKVEVMRFLKNKQYTDAKDFAGECESVVVIAKGQSVQGTCKYGTRVDYILASPECPYKFVPGSYAVLSSKGTSDHHIVKVDVVKADDTHQQQDVNSNAMRKRRRRRQQEQQKVVKITSTTPPSKGIWKT